MKTVLKIALGIILGFVILIGGCSALFVNSVDEAINETETTVEQTEEGNIETRDNKYEFIEEPTLTKDEFGLQYITGVIKNTSGSDKEYIQISFTLYDADGNNIGTAFANTANLKDGGTWKFEAMILEDNFASFEIDEITGF